MEPDKALLCIMASMIVAADKEISLTVAVQQALGIFTEVEDQVGELHSEGELHGKKTESTGTTGEERTEETNPTNTQEQQVLKVEGEHTSERC